MKFFIFIIQNSNLNHAVTLHTYFTKFNKTPKLSSMQYVNTIQKQYHISKNPFVTHLQKKATESSPPFFDVARNTASQSITEASTGSGFDIGP